MLAKYGFLDLDFVTPRLLLSAADRLNRAAIRDLGYSPRPASQERRGCGCAETLISNGKQETHLRIFLNSELSRDAMARILDETKQHYAMGMDAMTTAISVIAKKSKKSFPITFVIEDACLTNCDAIWLAKHFYL
jgi:hypothetical protein